jgi:hypothetical protein
MEVRVLCGSYVRSSPFIEGGCACDWTEILDESAGRIACPACGQSCAEEFVASAHQILERKPVFVLGCPHRAFTFSRRTREPFFLSDAVGPDADGSDPDESWEG